MLKKQLWGIVGLLFLITGILSAQQFGLQSNNISHIISVPVDGYRGGSRTAGGINMQLY